MPCKAPLCRQETILFRQMKESKRKLKPIVFQLNWYRHTPEELDGICRDKILIRRRRQVIRRINTDCKWKKFVHGRKNMITNIQV